MFPDEIEKVVGAFINYISEHDFKFLKTEFHAKWIYLIKKLAYLYQFYNSLDDYGKTVNNLKKEDRFSELKNGYPIDRKKNELEKSGV